MSQTPQIFVWADGARHFVGTDGGQYGDAVLLFDGCTLTIRADAPCIRRIELVWLHQIPPDAKILSDAWERGYGDLAWKRPEEAGAMPWYFLENSGGTTRGFGVKTQPGALCFWTLSEGFLTLTADISCGKHSVCLEGRTLQVCEVVQERYEGDSFLAARQFCEAMCGNPRLPKRCVYGGNDWYCCYGDSSYEKILEHTRRIVACSPPDAERPYMVVDDGWELCHHPKHTEEAFFNGGPWRACNRNFGDMRRLAEEITALGAEPGIWFRPLWTTEKFPDSYILKYRGLQYTLDPSVPEVLEVIADDVRCLKGWGYRLIKHDFTSFDLFGRWGMDPDFLEMDVEFADRTKTTAEIIRNLYLTIRYAAGDDVLLIGCNTMSHLSAGIFELQRTGDDTSGTDWTRTKQMGVNTLAFRMCQHEKFYLCDADCVGITKAIPWQQNRAWLDVLAKSGTPLFVSIAEDAFTPEIQTDISAAFALASRRQPAAQPLDWLETPRPRMWKHADGVNRYTWTDTELKP